MDGIFVYIFPRGGEHSEALTNYSLGRILGIGTFGKVKIAEHNLT
jgi:5'-AMP-activated protein kinase, catalytic alpha subunit